MYNSKAFKQPDYDLTWFWDEVAKFNAIANPEGVNKERQFKLVKEELQEILDSTSEKEFLDGIIDSLVVLAPLVKRDSYKIYDSQKIKPDDFESDIRSGLWCGKCWFGELSYNLICVLVNYRASIKTRVGGMYRLTTELVFDNHESSTWYKNCKQVLESNMSKFIPVLNYKDGYLDEVKNKYPDVDVELVFREYEGESYCVFLNSETGKVLKGHSYYFDPDIKV